MSKFAINDRIRLSKEGVYAFGSGIEPQGKGGEGVVVKLYSEDQDEFTIHVEWDCGGQFNYRRCDLMRSQRVVVVGNELRLEES